MYTLPAPPARRPARCPLPVRPVSESHPPRRPPNAADAARARARDGQDPHVRGTIVPLSPAALDALVAEVGDPQQDPPVTSLFPLDLFVPIDTLIALVEDSMANLREAPGGTVNPALTEHVRAQLLRQRATFLADLRARAARGEPDLYCSLYPVDDTELGLDEPGNIDPELGF